MSNFKQNTLKIGLLIFRLTAGGILFYEGFLKVFVYGIKNVTTYFEELNFLFPILIAYFIGFFELIAGLLIILGLFTRIVSFLGAFEMAVATLLVNIPEGFTAATEVTILLFVIFLFLAIIGGGSFSLDRNLKLFLVTLVFISILFTPFLPKNIFAAGGGGGGGGGGTPPPPPCTEDTWECNDWALCGLAGIQSRICVLSNNCPTVETPKPEESQLCTPECTKDTWTCNNWTICSLRGQQTRTCSLTNDCSLVETLKPLEIQTCTPICNEDKYKCSSWSQCRENGHEYRNCTLINNCPEISSLKPKTIQVCAGLRCGQLETLKERITCRLNLSNEELSQEFKILYFPEYCKVEETQEDKNKCIIFYQKIGPCWEISPGPLRTQCAWKVIGLTSLNQEKKRCLVQSGENRIICTQKFKDKVEHLLLFHMYELNIQAEALLKRGDVDLEKVATFETFIETKKQELEKTKNIIEWKIIIQEVKEQWQKFIKKLL